MPSPYSAGSIFLQVVPSFRGVPEQIAREAREWPDRITDGFDEKLEKNVRDAGKKAGKALGDELGKGTKDAGKAAGDDYTGAFRQSLRRGIASAQRELNTTPLKLVLRDEGLRKTLDKVRADLGSLDKQVKLGMDSNGALMELRRVLGTLEDVQKKAQNVEVRSNVASVYRDLAGVEKRIQSLSGIDIEPNLKIDRQLGTFERRLKAGIKSALDGMPPLTLDDGPAYAQVEALRERLHSLDRDVELGVDSGQLFAELAAIEGAFHQIADTAGSMKLRVDGASGFKTVATMRAELESLSRITIEPEVKLERNLGAFERGFKSAIDNALRDLGGTDPSALGTTLAQRSANDLRKRLFDLGDLEIGVDISAETARNELQRIRDDLEKLRREHWSVDIDADTAAAAAQISGFLAALEAVDHEDIDVDVELKGVASAIASANALRSTLGHTKESLAETRREMASAGGGADDAANSFRAFNIRILGVAALGPLVVPVLGSIAAGLAALGPLAAVGAAGLGTLTLGLFGVGDAFKAMGDARTNGAREAADHARSVRSAANTVADAERGVASARESAARSAEAAGEQVEDALRGVENAERGLRAAQRSAQQAQEDLTRARADAAEQMEDLRLSVEGGALAERAAVLDLREAQRELAAARAEGVGGDDLERFILDVDQAELALRRAQETNGDLTAEAEKWARTGIEGSDGVIAAHERVQDAQQQIADAERGMADAQEALADARVEQSRAAVDGQRAIQDAQRNLTEAQIAYSEALGETTSSQEKLADAMAKLGPAGQAFVKFLDDLRPRFQALRSVAQAGFLPGFQEWIDSMVNYHGPLLTRTVGSISRAIGDMFSDFGASIRGPQFTALFEMINASGPRFIGQMSRILVNLGEGIASLIVAMEPLADLFGGWLEDATARFSAWAGSLQGSSGLRDFFEWVERVGPKVADFFWEFADALIAIGIAIAPFAEGMLEKFTTFFDWISELDPRILGPIVIGIAALTVALQVIFGLTALVHSFRTAIHLMTTSLVGLGAATRFLGWAGLLAAALYTLYQNSETWRAILDTLWHGVLEPLGELLGAVLLPLFEGLTDLLGGNIELLAAAVVGFASWKIITTVVGWVNMLRNSLIGLATAQALATGSGSASALAGIGALAAGARGALPLLGAVGVGAGAGLYATHNLGETGPMDANVRALQQGGAARERYLASVNRGRNAAFDTDLAVQYMPFLASDQEELDYQNSQGAAEAAQAYDDWFSSLSNVEQAQAKVAEWTATLEYRQRSGTATADELAAAHRRVNYWTGVLRDTQEETVTASDRLTESMTAQQSAIIAVADAEIAYAQAKADLGSVFAEYQAVMADVNATDEDRRRAEEQWTAQSRQTAEAAKQAALARAAGLPDLEREARGNAALLVDLDRQKQVYGELPPRLQELRDSLAGTVSPAQYLAAQFDALGGEILAVPDSKTIILESATDEEIQKMRDLGFHIETLEDGSVKVTAETEEAAAAIDELTKPRTLTITAHVDPFKQSYDQVAGRTYRGQGGDEFASGGFVRGPGTWTSDSIPAYLSNGEFVVRAASVAKYGLGLLDAINQGQFQGPGGFAQGGLAKRKVKNGRPAFEDGGYVATYGGSINLGGLAIPELASFWVATVSTIQQASGMAAQAISQSFLNLRNAILANFMATGVQARLSWALMMAAITDEVNRGATTIGARVASLHAELSLRFGLVRIASVTEWSTMWKELGIVANNGAGAIGLRTMSLQNELDLRFALMRVNIVGHTNETMRLVGEAWGRLPGIIQGPVNTVIDAVLNNGLIAAFNGIVGQLGTGAAPLAGAKTVKLAAGGKVPGYSPNDKADNIPAWLTAGEFVQPVDVVRHYGVDFMEKLRKKELPRYATGGYVGMSNVIKNQFPWARITSTLRPGDPGYHGKGMAIDIGGSVPYPNPLAIKQMLEINRWIAANFGNITELIHTQPGAINLWHGKPHTYSAGTQAEHRNHVHWAMMGALLGGGGTFPGMAGGFGGDPMAAMRDAVEKSLKGFGDSPMHKILAEVPRKLAGIAGARLQQLMDAAFSEPMLDAAVGPALSGNRAANEALVKSMAEARGWGGQWGALRQLIMKESGFNNTAQNPTSTAYGMFQFLNGTWAGTGIPKTSDPRLQTEAGFRYIASRYGGPAAALAFHQRNNWYGEGGEVKPNQGTDGNGAIIPDLHDTGGWVMPGLNVLMNRTGKPEPVINPATLEALQSIAAGGGGSQALIGELHLPMVASNPKEAVDEVMHQVHVYSAGGRYRGVGD